MEPFHCSPQLSYEHIQAINYISYKNHNTIIIVNSLKHPQAKKESQTQSTIPVQIVKSVGDFIDDFDSVFFSHRRHLGVPALTVGLGVVLIGQLCDFPVGEQLGEHILRRSSHNKQPKEGKHTTCLQQQHRSEELTGFKDILTLMIFVVVEYPSTWS